MTLQEHQHLMRKLNQEYHEEMKPRLLGEQWRERQKKWLEIKSDSAVQSNESQTKNYT